MRSKRKPAKSFRRPAQAGSKTSAHSGSPAAACTHPILVSLPLSAIRANPEQPRRSFDEKPLKALADSLRERGMLQPVIVRRLSEPAEGEAPVGIPYELVAGERRLRAAALAGFTEIQAIVRDVSDDDMLVLALIENLHRENLNPIDKARGYRELCKNRKWSHEKIGRRFGEKRRTVSYSIQLLDLGDEVQALIGSGALGAWHGKALLGVSDAAKQAELARTAAEKGWCVRRLQTQIGRLGAHRPARANSDMAGVKELQLLLAQALGVKVTVRLGRRRANRSDHVQEKLQRATAWVRRAMEAVK